MRILLTGGTGFIGTAIALQFKQTGHKISVYANTENSELLENKIDFIKGDIFDEKKLKLALRKCDAVVHAVGYPGIEAVQNNPDMSFRLNIGSLQQVLEVMRQVALKKVIFISTAAVYGRTRTSPVSENAVARPVSLYGFHKYVSEEIARSYSNYYDFHVTIARLFNVYGNSENRFLKQLVVNGKKGTPVPVFGMDQMRDFMHVDDMAAVVIKLMELDNKFEIYNVGTGVGRFISDIVTMVKSQVPGLKLVYAPSAQKTYDSVADITKIKRAIGYKPDVSDRKMKLVIAGLKKNFVANQGWNGEI